MALVEDRRAFGIDMRALGKDRRALEEYFYEEGEGGARASLRENNCRSSGRYFRKDALRISAGK